jgi:Cu/Ag efflux pump CusA
LADETAVNSAIENAIKTTERDFQQRLEQMQTSLDNRISNLEKSMEAMVTTITQQIYASMSGANSPVASKLDHTSLQADVQGIATKMDSVLQLLQSKFTTPDTNMDANPKRPREFPTPTRDKPEKQPATASSPSYPRASKDTTMEGSEN